MMTRAFSARTIPGVWSNLALRGVLSCLGILLAFHTALFAQSGSAGLARGVEAFDNKRYAEAIQDLKAAQPQLPKLADYVAFYLASSRAELKDYQQVEKDLAPFRTLGFPSPLQGRATVLEASARTQAGSAASAIALLRERYSELPQPAADFALAEAYEAANQPAQAATYYQRVYYLFPLTDSSAQARKAMDSLRVSMGDAYPPPMPQQMLERGARLLAAREYSTARAEFSAMIPDLGGAEREIASVRVGAADYFQRKTDQAYRYLRLLEIVSPEADAERLYYVAECARRMNDDAAMLAALEKMAQKSPSSPWRLKALLSAGNRFLLTNSSQSYEPLYRACYESFPNDTDAAYCHWKVTWSAYLHRRGDAADLLREQIVRYPASTNSSAALYFLGRLAESAKDFRGARAYYDLIVQRYPGYYYSQIAGDRLAQPALARAVPGEQAATFLKTVAFPPAPLPRRYEPDPASARRIERFRKLSEAGLDRMAESELRFGAKTDGQPQVLAMELARAATAPHQGLRSMKSMAPDYLSLAPSDAPNQYWELLFPLPFRGDLVRQASAASLDPNMVAGLIRQESVFDPKALSRSKAYGLMQLLPSSGREWARKSGVKSFRTSMLFQPATNLQLGTRYLRSMLDQWGGKWEETLASYNAGKSRVIEWQKWGDFQEPAEFVETIPFTETRDYVQAVLRNAAAYRRIYGSRIVAAETSEPTKVQKVAATAPAKPPTKRARRAVRRS